MEKHPADSTITVDVAFDYGEGNAVPLQDLLSHVEARLVAERDWETLMALALQVKAHLQALGKVAH